MKSKTFTKHAERWQLDKEEQAELLNYEQTPRSNDDTLADRVALLQTTAKNTIQKSKSISIRLTPADYRAIRVRATEYGMPYQTLISTLIHRFGKGAIELS